MPKLLRKREVFYRLEAVEGVAELPVTATDAIEALDVSSSVERSLITREVSSASLSKAKDIVGASRGQIAFGIDVRSEASVTRDAIQPDESWATCLLACGMRRASTGVTYLLVGTTNSNTVLRGGELLEGATSNATARVLRPVAPSAAGVKVHVYLVSGTFQAGENIDAQFSQDDPMGGPGAPALFNLDASTPTGTEGKRWIFDSVSASRIDVVPGGWTGTPQVGEVIVGESGALGVLLTDNSGVGGDEHLVVEHTTGTPTFVSGNVVAGKASGAYITLASPTAQTQTRTPSLSLQDRIDGFLKYFKGARGNARFVGEVGNPLRWNFDFQCGISGVIDQQLSTDAVYPTESVIRLVAGVVDVDGIQFPLSAINLDFNNELAVRPDPNTTDGQRSVAIVSRDPTWTLDPEQVNVKAYDWYGKWANATSIRILLQAGTTSGNRFALVSSNLQVTNFGDSDRDGFLTADVELKARRIAGAGDDELEVMLW